MDAFYASVEVRRDPRLRGRPVVVAGSENRGVVLSASYEARRYGVRSAQPTAQARRLCPEGIFLAPELSSYRDESVAIREIFASYTPLVEPLSLDEAFLDVAGARRLFGDAVAIGTRMRCRIAEERRLVASVGVASTKLLAKLASRAAKPDGLLHVPPGDELAFLHPRRVGDLWGVGAASLEVMDRLGIRTVGELAATPVETLQRAFGRAAGSQLHALAHGRDDRDVVVDREPKSIGHEDTYPVDLADTGAIRTELLRLSDRVATRLRRNGFAGRTVTLKCRLANFATSTRSRTLREPTDAAPELYAVAVELYGRLHLERPAVRLLGVSVSNLVRVCGPVARQLSFDTAETDPGWQELLDVTEAVRARFGDTAVAPAALLRGPPPAGEERP